MMQIIGNIVDLKNFLVPSNANFVLKILFNISNFKIFENRNVQIWLKLYVFGHLDAVQNVIFGQGVFITGLFAFGAILILMIFLKVI
jgi:hypothetical protein